MIIIVIVMPRNIVLEASTVYEFHSSQILSAIDNLNCKVLFGRRQIWLS